MYLNVKPESCISLFIMVIKSDNTSNGNQMLGHLFDRNVSKNETVLLLSYWYGFQWQRWIDTVHLTRLFDYMTMNLNPIKRAIMTKIYEACYVKCGYIVDFV